ncbi:MAG: hypothetical protein B6D41_08680 [Chloroflexi bacterium UTCFX4]|jgi:serine/threonine protein kinase|nr:MAG: hypothetical protein B6D41_08680 [Chloroflexi bacterium UTCFX4]
MLTSGTLLQNRYRIIQPLGSGGQGAVYLAQHLGLNTYVAIKESFSNDPHSNAQFQTEANLLAHLSHPNLPRVTDFFIEPNGARYLVMEYVQGENLEALVQQRGAPISENEALNWFRQIFDAVKYLHTNHVIHRDIKPQNIIITPQHRAVLVDFGIAKVMASGALTGASMRFGSPGYASPEQYSGGTNERSDIYSLGATLYFALTGQTPPEAPMRAAGTKVIPPRQLNAGISQNVERAVLKAMEMNSGQRFGSIQELTNAWQIRLTNNRMFAIAGFVSTAILLLGFFLVTRALPIWGNTAATYPTLNVLPTPPAIATSLPPSPTPPKTDAISPTHPPLPPTVAPPLIEPTLLPTPTTVGDTGGIPILVPAIAGECPNPYTVQRGEWFLSIARKCGVTPQELLAANPGLNPNALRLGQTIRIPQPGEVFPTITPQTIGTVPADDTITEVPSTGGCSNPYTVERGDTINSIARKCGTTVEALMQTNGIPAPEYIFPGQHLRIP